MKRLFRTSLASSGVLSGCCAVPASRSLHLSSSRLAATNTPSPATPTPPIAAAPSSTTTTTTTAIAAGPYRRVGNIFIVTCIDHPFKFSWEVNRMLRDLRLEFMGQTTIVPDIPQVRKQLWRVRHIVRVDHIDLDEAKALVGVPEHIAFRDLAAQIAPTFGRGGAMANPHTRSKVNFMRLRRLRLRDVMHRDQLEKRLLEEKRSALARASAPAAETSA